MIGLKYPYPSVEKAGVRSYGGSQLWSDSAVVRKCGCGPVAALDAAIYLSRRGNGSGKQLSAMRSDEPIPFPIYDALLKRLSHSYFPIVPPFGINQAVLTVGLNRLFRDEHLPFRAHVSIAADNMWATIDLCLREDRPVLLAIGQNFPKVWQKNRVTFYLKRPDGTFRAVAATKAHFVCVTGMDEDYLRISSWGDEYYVNRIELATYVKKHSTSLISGIVYVTAR